MQNLVAEIQKKFAKYKNKQALLLLDGAVENAQSSFAEVNQFANTLAFFLQENKLFQQRVLLLFPAGVDFIKTFIGCLYAGVVAVPVNCPASHEIDTALEQIIAIGNDAEIAGIITTTDYLSSIEKFKTQFQNSNIIVIDVNQINQKPSYQNIPIDYNGDEIAYLQYTSGSTSRPKAAIITHKNLLHSLKHTSDAWKYTKNSISITWAPHTHVYGLVCGLLLPLFNGTLAIIMPTVSFVRQPVRWLQAISKYRVTHSGCPNFGYDLCVKNIPATAMEGLDLRSWLVAVNGGEAVKAETLQNFAKKFASAGFNLKKFNSAYGMSEVSGAIALSQYANEPTFLNVDLDSIQDHLVRKNKNAKATREFVMNGKLLPCLQVAIVNPETLQAVDEDAIGEIWLAGDSVARGYWQRQNETTAAFNFQLENDTNHYFRTGDLGFIHQGELCVSGRLKEMIVIHGKKYYPLDIEATIRESLQHYEKMGTNAVFSIIRDNQEVVIVVQETLQNLADSELNKIKIAIKSAIQKKHGIDIYDSLFVAENTIPKTTSGKIQRKKLQENYLADQIKSYHAPAHRMNAKPMPSQPEQKFVQLIADVLKLSTTEIELDAPLSRYHFDSINIIKLTGALNEVYELEISPATLYEFTTLREFCNANITGNKKIATVQQNSQAIQSTDIAIIGMSGVFPNAANLRQFWENLRTGKDCISEIPAQRWNWQSYYGDPLAEANKTNVKWGGFIENIAGFDAKFFNISAHEAELMDPQQRLFLTATWRAIEDAGYAVTTLAEQKTGLFVGAFNHDYAEILQRENITDAFITTGLSHSIIANRISYLLNFRGPSEVIDTACSSSLVAIHHAIQALQHGDCEIAIAGGVNALLTPTAYLSASKAGMLSIDGRCKTFDKNANGYVRSEGVAALVLKPLSAAVRDQDHIYAVIKGSAINHGGHVNSLTVPNPNAQAELIVAACERGNVAVDTISYIEAHGTGTPLGDPIEINGLKKAFNLLAEKQDQKKLASHYCAIGSVKSHVGHLESAAGIAGIIKVVLSLQHEFLPANLHFNEINPYIDIENSPFYIMRESKAWPKNPSKKRRAGVSSFGFGGTNAHVVLEEAPEMTDVNVVTDQAHLIFLSAKDETALKNRIDQLRDWLDQNDNVSLTALSYTLNTGRMHYSQRCALIVDDVANLQRGLANISSNQVINLTLATELEVLANRYIRGDDAVLQALTYSTKQRLSLPTYPFREQKYWVSVQQSHELFITGTEKYCQQHLVNNEKIIPAAAYLNFIATLENKQHDLYFRDLIWYQPIKMQDTARNLSINIEKKNFTQRFEVCAAESIYAVGTVVAGIDFKPEQTINSATLTESKTIQKKAFYERFVAMGIEYGDEFQVVQEVTYNENSLFAKLKTFAPLAQDSLLNPFLLDGILQTTAMLIPQTEDIFVPFSMQQFNLYRDLPRYCFVHAKKSAAYKDDLPCFDMQITDAENTLCGEIKGFTLNLIFKQDEVNYYEPKWITAQPEARQRKFDNLLVYSNSSELFGVLNHAKLGNVSWLKPGTEIPVLPLNTCIIVDYDKQTSSECFATALQLIQRLIPQVKNQTIDVIHLLQPNQHLSTALTAFSKTLHLESSAIQSRVIQLQDKQKIIAELNENDIQVICHENGNREVMTYARMNLAMPTMPVFKTNGVYLITGGSGGLGLIFANYLLEHYHAKVILAGRSSVVSIQSKLGTYAEKLIYLQADVSERIQVKDLLQTIIAQFGCLNGIIHAAGVIKDDFLQVKSLQAANAVLAAKIAACVNLDEESKHLSLDFFVTFSSAASVFGNPGQGDYAFANGFMDDYMAHRHELSRQQQRKGISLSIQWPLWTEGGMKMDAHIQQVLADSLGIQPITPKNGIKAFIAALNSGSANVAVLPGKRDKLESVLAKRSSVVSMQTSSSDNNVDVQVIAHYLRNIVAECIKQPATDIDTNINFNEYGVDSVMIINLNHRLEKIFGDLPKTLFFEFKNLHELSHYFKQKHLDTLTKLIPNLKDNQTAPNKHSVPVVQQHHNNSDIAIIGLNGAYPDAKDIETFWDNLQSGKNSIREIPSSRWNNADYFTSEKDVVGKTYSKWGGFLEAIDQFDPLFFNISPREAEQMDPQERLFLQTAWKTIEDAGYVADALAGQRVGVYVGVMYGQYQLLHATTNSMYASIANRVSYFLNLHGPSMAVDTMCSSALTAIHLACKSILAGECDLAIAGGVNLHVHPNKYLLLSQGNFLATDGHCHSFGADGDGYVPGEGVGAVLLKPLALALKDNDHIYAVIKGSSINHGGKTNGYTVPDPGAQAAVMQEAYALANVDPTSISYIEAHGTGTALGDPIEIAGLCKVFPAREKPYAIGSVKSNIGHCESAAGIAGLTKVILQMQHKMLVPSLHAARLNPNIQWQEVPFQVQQTLSPWIATDNQPLRACISSFGAGGANAHLILEAAPQPATQLKDNKPAYLFAFSAKSTAALFDRVQDFKHWLSIHPDIDDLERISYGLNVGRKHFNHRAIIYVTSYTDLQNKIEDILNQQLSATVLLNLEGTSSNTSYSWQVQHDLLEISKHYVKGHIIPWHELYKNTKVQKISLPTYPFAKESYWINTPIAAMSMNNEMYLPSLEASLQTIICEQLKLKSHQFDPNKNVSEYGVDSVQFIAIMKTINKKYALNLSPAIFYLHNTVKQFSQYLLAEFPSAINRIHDVSTAIKSHFQPLPRLISHVRSNNSPIAIIGMQGVFPQADTLDEFWQHLINGEDSVTEVPKERWNWQDKSHSRWGGFIRNVDQFAAEFFNISAREANFMDPQQRLFLETVWKTIEDAGYDPMSFAEQKVGVFAGVEFSEYQVLLAKQQNEFHGFIATGNSHSMIANRVSYYLNLRGPSEAIATACSSSLVAIHRAVNAIRQQECDLAIAGGVSLILNPDTVTITNQLGALSPDGRCKTFDKSANGYVKGEGVGAILLKSLDQALHDGDHVYGVIRGSAVNHGGKAQSLTAPNAAAQRELLLQAYSQAEIDPASLSYIETHGTGTALGDPIEIEALKAAFKTLLGDKQTKIGLGSLKTNIGHLEPASGIASMIKVLLALRHEVIPQNIHFQNLNPYISLENSPFYLLNSATAWPHTSTRVAGISSFGFGGTNAHLILEGATARSANQENKKPCYLFTLSAKTTQALQQKINDLITWLQANKSVDLAALSYTLNRGRTHFEYRCAFVASSHEQLLDNIQSVDLLRSDPLLKVHGPIFDELYKMAMQGLTSQDPIIYREKLLLIADFYLKYYSVNWDNIHAAEMPQRIAGLPTYPFEKQRYWFDESRVDTSVVPALPAITKKLAITQADVPTQTLQYLQQIFAAKLGIAASKIAYDQTYEVYGVDSLIGLEVTNRLETDFPGISKTLLYERNNLRDLAKYFQRHYPEQLQNLFGNSIDVPANQIVTHAVQPTANLSPTTSSDIAIIGLSFDLPMANDQETFWHNLMTGKNCISEVPSERWNYKDFPAQVAGKETYFPHGGFLNDIDKFDALFFNISPRDAALMDPQERLFLQTAWATMEDAGYTRDKIRSLANNSVGVFVGATYNYYPVFIAEEWHKGNQVPMDIQMFSMANRVSYFLNVNGPSFVIDTACSSSLAAIHLACESILRGECQMALAGGVNLSLHPSKYHFLGSFNFMSPEGRCASFAEGGSGYVPAEGVGSVLLKPLNLAIRDNDRIYGVIKASAMNHGGKTSGYTVPNPNAQANVISAALQRANIKADSISYIEAHGTGTSLGDPIEVRGLQDAFEQDTNAKQFCALGSVKSNIGHCESAAGISQLAKVLLQLKHKKLAPSIHAETLNPYINFKESAFYVQRELSDWKVDKYPRRAGISAFGAGGTNVHVIVEEYSAKSVTSTQSGPYLFLLSAVNHERLLAYTKLMHAYISNHSEKNQPNWLSNLCFSSQTGRESMAAKLAVIANSAAELVTGLQCYVDKQSQKQLYTNENLTLKAVENIDVQRLLTACEYEELVDLWLHGVDIPWHELQINQGKQMISLPTYPYTKRRCWITTKNIPDTSPKPEIVEKAFATQAELEDWLYVMRWQQTENVTGKLTGHWLIFSDHELGLVLRNQLGAAHTTLCFRGERFQKHAEDIYYYNPDNSSDYLALFQDMHAAQNTHLQGIIYLCTEDDHPPQQTSHRLMDVLQASIKFQWANKLTFAVVTRGAQAVLETDKVPQLLRHLASFTRVFAVEQPQYQSVILDLDREKSLHADSQHIIAELANISNAQAQAAYRKNVRYVLQMQRYGEIEQTPKRQIPAVALVTGGLGALGIEVAKWLVANGCRDLLLTGSKPLTTSTNAATDEKIQALTFLEQAGAKVTYTAVDVADREKMQECVNHYEANIGKKIAGVFHLAGVTTDNLPIPQLSNEILHAVLNVKINGSLTLHEIFKQHHLVSFMLFSSIAAVPHFGMNGLSAYAMANEFMDGLAQHRKQQGLVATSVNWIAWAEKGMSHRYHHGSFLSAVGMAEISIRQGMEVFTQIYHAAEANIIVAKIHWDKFLQVNPIAKQLAFFKAFTQFVSVKKVANEYATLSQAEILTLLLNTFANSLELTLDEIDTNTIFENYGMDSILGVKFITDLSEKFPDVLTAMDLYRFPTLQKLSEFIASELHGNVAAPTMQSIATPVEDDLEKMVATLSDAEVTALLEEELKELELYA